MTIVTESAVRGAVLFSRTASSLYQGELELIAAVTVTPPLPPPPPSFTVRPTVVVRVIFPPAPVTVNVTAPSVAVLDAERVKTLLPAVPGFGLKLAVTPAGAPLALNVTPPVKPPVRVIVIVLVPLEPRLIVKLAGLADSVKSGGCTSLTVRLNGMVLAKPPPVPVMLIVTAPSAAVLDAVTVISALPPGAGFGLKLMVTPAGAPALSVTASAKPPVRVIVIVLVPLAPRATFRLVGEADSAKSGGCGWLTVRFIGVVRVSPPPVPVIVIGAIPSVAVLDAVSVRTLLSPVVDGGAKLAVTPVGNPPALRVTALLKPPLRVIVIALVPLAPRLIVRLAGLAESAKSGLGGPGSAPKTLVAPS